MPIEPFVGKAIFVTASWRRPDSDSLMETDGTFSDENHLTFGVLLYRGVSLVIFKDQKKTLSDKGLDMDI